MDLQDPAVRVLARICRHRVVSATESIPGSWLRQPAESFDGDEAYWTGGIHALLGDVEAALAWLRRAIDLGNHNYPFFQRDRNYARLRGHADYDAMLADVRRHWERNRALFGGAS